MKGLNNILTEEGKRPGRGLLEKQTHNIELHFHWESRAQKRLTTKWWEPVKVGVA
jgi:hypothetical protein